MARGRLAIWLEAARRSLPAIWLGWTLCVALLATPAPFALLATAEAGRVAGRMLAQEAYTALALGVVVVLLERMKTRSAVSAVSTVPGSQLTASMVFALGALFCTVMGYFALQPMMASARAGQGVLSFGQLHAASAAFFLLKLSLICMLTWRGAQADRQPTQA